MNIQENMDLVASTGERIKKSVCPEARFMQRLVLSLHTGSRNFKFLSVSAIRALAEVSIASLEQAPLLVDSTFYLLCLGEGRGVGSLRSSLPIMLFFCVLRARSHNPAHGALCIH